MRGNRLDGEYFVLLLFLSSSTKGRFTLGSEPEYTHSINFNDVLVAKIPKSLYTPPLLNHSDKNG